jgi:hypothetical protein
VTWVAHDTRDSVVDFIRYWSTLTELAVGRFVVSCAGSVSPRASICVGTLAMGESTNTMH